MAALSPKYKGLRARFSTKLNIGSHLFPRYHAKSANRVIVTMSKTKFILFSAICLSWLLLPFVKADSINMRFVNQHGEPLANLVVEVFLKEASSSEQAPPQKAHVMDQVDKAFKPELLVVSKNDQVAFPNSDNIRHHVYSFSAAKPFELKLYSGKPSSPVSFNQHGVVTLGCNIHDSMVGFIYVADSDLVKVTDRKGEIILESPNAIERLTSWHSEQASSPENPKPVKFDLASKSELIEVVIETVKPAKRDTFGAKFSNEE